MPLNMTMQETWLHRVNPSWKLFWMVALFLYLLLTHNPNVMLNMAVVTGCLLYTFSGHPGRRMLLLSLPIALLFVSSMTAMVFYGKGETTWWKWGLIHVTEESFFRGLQIGLKSLNFAFVGLLFALTTRPVLLFYSLMQQCRVPPKYAYSFMAGVRLLPMMIEEFQTLRQAMHVRGIGREKGLRGLLRKTRAYVIPMLAQSIRRAQRIAVAMEAKRFGGNKKRTYYYEVGFSRFDAVFVVALLVGCWAAYTVGHVWPYVAITDVRTTG